MHQSYNIVPLTSNNLDDALRVGANFFRYFIKFCPIVANAEFDGFSNFFHWIYCNYQYVIQYFNQSWILFIFPIHLIFILQLKLTEFVILMVLYLANSVFYDVI